MYVVILSACYCAVRQISMGKLIDLYWDLGSTNTYFALKLIPPLAARYDATIVWHPFNLGHVFQLSLIHI